MNICFSIFQRTALFCVVGTQAIITDGAVPTTQVKIFGLSIPQAHMEGVLVISFSAVPQIWNISLPNTGVINCSLRLMSKIFSFSPTLTQTSAIKLTFYCSYRQFGDYHPDVGLIVAGGINPASKSVYISDDLGKTDSRLTDLPYGSGSSVYGGCLLIINKTTIFVAGGYCKSLHKFSLISCNASFSGQSSIENNYCVNCTLLQPNVIWFMVKSKKLN